MNTGRWGRGECGKQRHYKPEEYGHRVRANGGQYWGMSGVDVIGNGVGIQNKIKQGPRLPLKKKIIIKNPIEV